MVFRNSRRPKNDQDFEHDPSRAKKEKKEKEAVLVLTITREYLQISLASLVKSCIRQLELELISELILISCDHPDFSSRRLLGNEGAHQWNGMA